MSEAVPPINCCDGTKGWIWMGAKLWPNQAVARKKAEASAAVMDGMDVKLDANSKMNARIGKMVEVLLKFGIKLLRNVQSFGILQGASPGKSSTRPGVMCAE